MGYLSSFRKAPHKDCFGVEIECYPMIQPNDGEHVGFFGVTLDSSLERGGREFISQPMPYEMLRTHIVKLHKRIAGWETDNRCGLHIHVSRGSWGREPEFSSFLLICGISANMRRWFGRDSRYALSSTSRDDKFRAINVLHPASYEFRVWKMGDLNWVLEALRRTRDIIQFKGPYTIEAMDRICGVNTLPR